MAATKQKRKLNPVDFVITVVTIGVTLAVNKFVTGFEIFNVFTWLFFGLFIFWTIRMNQVKSHAAKTTLEKTILSKKTEAYAMYPRVDAEKCLGCASCTAVCPEGDILQMIDNFPVLVQPTKCVGHSLCARSCPYDAITMVFGTETNGKEIPDYDGNYQTNVPGLYIAGELGGMGLISNAIKQGSIAAEHAIQNLDLSVSADADADVLVVGAGPAGLSASLKCIEKRVRYRCIDQNSFGGTVANYPRQKLVMSHPAALPVVGRMKFPKSRVAKEELLEYWTSVRRRTGLRVEEKTKFTNLKVNGKVLEAETSSGVIRAQKVILCVGVGGSPRKLGLPNEDMPKVAYTLLDPSQYRGKNVCVVGAGDSAVEAAQRLAEPRWNNRTHLLVRGDALSRCKEDNKTKIERMERDGLLQIFYKSTVKEIHPQKLVVQKGAEVVELPNDALLLFMGTVPPFGFLKELGVQIRKLYGDPLARKAS